METQSNGSIIKICFILAWFWALLFCSTSTYADTRKAVDPNENITIKWDIMSWTVDGYVASVTISNFQKHRHVGAPGWSLKWTWARAEVIWTIFGAKATDQGDCSKFKGNIPHNCKRIPTIVDLHPGAPTNQRVQNCCKGGILSPWVQDPAKLSSSFQMTVGLTGTTNRTVQLPKNFTLRAPGPGYTCGPAKNVKPTRFLSADKRRITQALMTWNVTCTYSSHK